MATGTISLPIMGAIGDQTNPPGMGLYSAGAGDLTYWQLLFDDTTSEGVFWQFRLPANYASSPVLKLQYKMASATADEVRWDAEIAAVAEGETAEGSLFDTANVVDDTVEDAAGELCELSLALTNNDSMAAGEFITLFLFRDASSGNDNATGDAELIAASIEFTTS